MGHLAVKFGAKGIGHRIIGIDHSSKRDLVLETGAEHFIAFDETKDVVAAVKEVTGGLGAHAAVICTASNAAYAQGLEFLRFRGTLVCVGIPEGDMVPIATALPQTMVAKALKIVGSAVGDRREAIETLDFAARGVVKTHYTVEKMDKLTSVFESMDKGQMKGRVVLDLQ